MAGAAIAPSVSGEVESAQDRGDPPIPFNNARQGLRVIAAELTVGHGQSGLQPQGIIFPSA